MKYTNEAGTIEGLFINYSKDALDIYKYLNPEVFPSDLTVLNIFEHCLKEIYRIHNQDVELYIQDFIPMIIPENNRVLLAFSGGLDSMYQAFYLKDKGYGVTLFHVKNMNYYTNGKEYQVVEEFSTKYNFDFVVYSFKQNTKENPYKKHWRENSFKNILLYTMMLDYCCHCGIHYISSGDDLRLNPKDCVIGTNVADVHTVNLSFFEDVKKKFNIDVIWTNPEHKGIRLQKLQELGALDNFYSCVNPGRFNQSNHNRIQNKFNVKIEKWNCGVCRKCAFHSLLRYYYLHENYPQDFIDFCWSKICIGADYEFFKPTLPMDVRISNLYNY